MMLQQSAQRVIGAAAYAVSPHEIMAEANFSTVQRKVSEAISGLFTGSVLRSLPLSQWTQTF
jgi:hypothetical protein